MQQPGVTDPQLQLAPTEHANAAKSATDPHRPVYHFLPPANWMNDPNGVIQWQGQYHLFYQHNPNGPFWGTMHWGHAVSSDLVHWTHLPIALAPTPGSVDQDGCFSGCAVDNNGTPTLIYTGVQGTRQLPCIATSADNLLTWEKHPRNPVIPMPPPDLDLVAFRDHSVWKEDDTWYQVIGSGIVGAGGAALLYRSQDLIDWEYLHPITVGDQQQRQPVWTGSMWECPDFYPLDEKHVLCVSVWENGRTHYPVYMVGTYTEHTFRPETRGKIDLGNSFYAPQSMSDDQGRRIMWGWLREARSGPAQQAAGWSGVMSLPRILGVDPDGSLIMEPAPELQVLRGAHRRWKDIEVTPDSMHVLQNVQGDALEIIAEWEMGDAMRFGIKVRCSPDRTEETPITFDRVGNRLIIHRLESSLDGAAERDMESGSFELRNGETLKLHIFLDRSIVEVYANGRACLTTRIYPFHSDSLGLDLFARDGSVHLKALDIWEMNGIWAT